jgi:hypothetical protein
LNFEYILTKLYIEMRSFAGFILQALHCGMVANYVSRHCYERVFFGTTVNGTQGIQIWSVRRFAGTMLKQSIKPINNSKE